MLDPSAGKVARRTAAAEKLIDVRVLEGIPDAVTVQDAQGRIVWANGAAAKVLGTGPDEEPSARPDRFEIFDESGDRVPIERLPGRLALQGTPTTGMVLRVHDTDI